MRGILAPSDTKEHFIMNDMTVFDALRDLISMLHADRSRKDELSPAMHFLLWTMVDTFSIKDIKNGVPEDPLPLDMAVFISDEQYLELGADPEQLAAFRKIYGGGE